MQRGVTVLEVEGTCRSGSQGLGSPSGHLLTCPVISAGSQGDHLPSHKPQAPGEPAKPRHQGELQVPWEKPPCSDIPVPVQSGGEPGCSVWASGISGASICWPQTPSLHQVQVLQVARYMPWAHGHREVLLATQEYPSHTLFPASGWP